MTAQEAMADLMLSQADVFYRPKDDSIDIAIIALKDIIEISNALAAVMEYECSLYGFDNAYKLAKKWQRRADNEN